MRILLVPHGPKIEDLEGQPQELRANPPMTLAGLKVILGIVPKIKEFGPFAGFYSSYSMRALDTASVLAFALDESFKTMKSLTVHGNLIVPPQGAQETVNYAGHEDDNMVTWHLNSLMAVYEISNAHKSNDVVLVVCHRPIVAGIVGHIRGIHDLAGLTALAHDKTLIQDGFVTVEILDTGEMTIIVP